MFKLFLKFIFILTSIALVFVFVFSYEIFSTSQKIFSQENDNVSMIKQFGEMIFSPSDKLNGEQNGKVNILLLGIGGEGHSGGELTDTVMIASIRPRSQEVALLSIPRDLYVQISGTNINSKINAVKTMGDKNKEKNGMELLTKTVEEVSGLDINYYVQLDFNGFIKMVDDLGGIDIELENDINDPTYPNFSRGYDPFYISKGWHHLNGATALKVARSRHSIMGDFDRIKRQQIIIKAVKQKLYERYSKFDVLSFKNIFLDLGDHLKTNIEPKEMPRFYKIIKEIKNHKITAATIDTKEYLSRAYVGMGYTLQPKTGDYEEIKKFSENIFDIEVSDQRKELIKKERGGIEIRNGTGSLDLANSVAQDLEKLEYRIINSTNINPPEFSAVLIYDNSNGLKPVTMQFLKEKFNAVITELPAGESSRADFVIVLGRGF